MFGHDFLSGYSAKILEYGLAVTYLVLFVGFWRYVQGGKKAPAMEMKPEAEKAPVAAGWFEVPSEVAFHPGHTWARMEANGTVSVGLDDLGHRLVGGVEGVRLPQAGRAVEQGEPVVTLLSGGKEIGLLSPVAGEVVATNGSAGENGSEPYGAGWLFQVKPSQWTRSRAQLIDGQAAREWMEEQARQLYGRMSPEAVPMLQDGGVPIHGIAREIEPARWDEVAREFFRTQES